MSKQFSAAVDHCERLLARGHRRREIAERVYGAFLKEAEGLPEAEWRGALLESVTKLLNGMDCSLLADMAKLDHEFHVRREAGEVHHDANTDPHNA